MTNKIEPAQKEILIKFIETFLPKRGNKRKSSHNEIEYIGRTLGGIFNKYFGFHISNRHVLDAFEELRYSIFFRKGKWDPEKKEYMPSSQGTCIRGDSVYKDNDAAFIYIDIEPAIVGQLRLVTAGLPSSTGEERLNGKKEMTKRILLFGQTIKDKSNAS